MVGALVTFQPEKSRLESLLRAEQKSKLICALLQKLSLADV